MADLRRVQLLRRFSCRRQTTATNLCYGGNFELNISKMFFRKKTVKWPWPLTHYQYENIQVSDIVSMTVRPSDAFVAVKDQVTNNR